MNRRVTILLFCLSLITPPAHASWTRIVIFDRPASCGFFFDKDHGMLGFGNRNWNDARSCVIRKTSDGGITWTPCKTPVGPGSISSIFMQDRLTGYASIMTSALFSLWKTTDGGDSWFNIPPNRKIPSATCVYATSTAIVETTWYTIGGRSLDGGTTISQDFVGGQYDQSNAVDFLDDKIGVVTLGPDQKSKPWDCRTYRTTDGGASWMAGGSMHEAWGVYACKANGNFYALAEGPSFAPMNEVFVSADAGASWSRIADFSAIQKSHFTGHIAGKANEMYVQSDSAFGIFRSDNFGATWRNVGGPCNLRDTRFAVTGCIGETVYAFDDSGGVWKTTDGGDGSLTPPSYAVAFDTTTRHSHYCTPQPLTVYLLASTCDSLRIDSLFVSDSSGVVTLDHTPIHGGIASGLGDSVRWIFRSDSNASYRVQLHLKGSSGSMPIDTVFWVVINNSFDSTAGPTLGLVFDSVKVKAHYCEGVLITFPFSNANNCDPVEIDTIEFDDPSNEFVITHAPAGGLIATGANDSITLQYQSVNNEHRVVTIRLKCRIAGRVFDTTLYADASHSRSPEPYLEDPIPTRIGDTVAFALRLRAPADTINFSHIGFHLSYDGDILTLAQNPTMTANTLSEGYTALMLTQTGPGDLDCSVDLKNPITNASDLTKPVIILRFMVSLTRALSCPVILDSFSIVGNTALLQCSIPSTTFTVLTQCGDSIISRFMLDGTMPGFASIHPNPSDRSVEFVVDLGGRNRAGLQLVDLLGHVIAEQVVDGPNQRTLRFDTSRLPSGRYYLRMLASDGTARTAPLEIAH